MHYDHDTIKQLILLIMLPSYVFLLVFLYIVINYVYNVNIVKVAKKKQKNCDTPYYLRKKN